MGEPLPAHARAEILDRTGDLIAERQEEIARTICAEAGKPMKAARVEAERAVSTFRAAAAEARTLAGESSRWTRARRASARSRSRSGSRSASSARSRPFNFPFNLVAHKIAPALAAGCAVVLKPASADAALGAPPRRARGRGGPAAGLAERPRRQRRPRSATSSSRTSACG